MLHPYYSLVMLIPDLINRKWDVRFCHVLKLGNFDAYWLAKYGANHEESLHVWISCPLQL